MTLGQRQCVRFETAFIALGWYYQQTEEATVLPDRLFGEILRRYFGAGF